MRKKLRMTIKKTRRCVEQGVLQKSKACVTEQDARVSHKSTKGTSLSYLSLGYKSATCPCPFFTERFRSFPFLKAYVWVANRDSQSPKLTFSHFDLPSCRTTPHNQVVTRKFQFWMIILAFFVLFWINRILRFIVWGLGFLLFFPFLCISGCFAPSRLQLLLVACSDDAKLLLMGWMAAHAMTAMTALRSTTPSFPSSFFRIQEECTLHPTNHKKKN